MRSSVITEIPVFLSFDGARVVESAREEQPNARREQTVNCSRVKGKRDRDVITRYGSVTRA